MFVVELKIVDGNPFVLLPPTVLTDVFVAAGRSKGPIPVRGTINAKPYQQTLGEVPRCVAAVRQHEDARRFTSADR